MNEIPTQLFINGEVRKPSTNKVISLTNPATEEAIAEVAAATDGDVALAIEGAHQAYRRGWRDLAPGKRTEILFNISRQRGVRC
jgi:gamma-glutamyl-gamma-aminobutyraldehyde dehydrogenase